MAPDSRCDSINAAMANKGISYAQIADGIFSTEDRVKAILQGTAKATAAEFNAIAAYLGINTSHLPPGHTSG